MASTEQEVLNALRARSALLLDVASACISLADYDPLFGAGPEYEASHPSDELSRIRGAMADLSDTEALTATVLGRCGASWDVLGSRLNVSRQSLHRRLARRGESLFAEVQRGPDMYLEDMIRHSAWIAAKVGDGVLDQVPNRLEYAAKQLMVLRRTPRWWGYRWR